MVQYFIIRGKDGKPINNQLLPIVGEPVQLSGTAVQYDDWMVPQVDGLGSVKGWAPVSCWMLDVFCDCVGLGGLAPSRMISSFALFPHPSGNSASLNCTSIYRCA